ncbi:uncharacterized protein [Panulirus ornatus]
MAKNVVGAACEFFSNLLQSGTHNQHVDRSHIISIAIQGSVSSPSLSATDEHTALPAMPVSCAKSMKDCNEMRSGLVNLGVSTPVTLTHHQQTGLHTPQQGEGSSLTCPSTPIAAVRPKKHHCAITPSNTHTPFVTNDIDMTHIQKTRKLSSPLGKKRLTFADISLHSSVEKENDLPHSCRNRNVKSTSHSSSCESLPETLRTNYRSFCSKSEHEIFNTNRPRENSESKNEFSPAECSQNLKRAKPLTTNTLKCWPTNGTDSSLMTVEQKPYYSEEHRRPKGNSFRSPKRSYESFSDDSDSGELSYFTPNCGENAFNKRINSADDNWRILNDKRSFRSRVSLTYNNNAAGSTVSAVMCPKNTKHYYPEVSPNEKLNKSTQPSLTPFETWDMNLQSFVIEQKGFLNFLSENGEKKNSPIAYNSESCTTPKQQSKSLPFTSPSSFLRIDFPVATNSSLDNGSSVCCSLEDEFQVSKDVCRPEVKDIAHNSSASNFSSHMHDIGSNPVADVNYKESKTLNELKFTSEGEKTIIFSHQMNKSIQESHTPKKGLDTSVSKCTTPKQPSVAFSSHSLTCNLQSETCGLRSVETDQHPTVSTSHCSEHVDTNNPNPQISDLQICTDRLVSQGLHPDTSNQHILTLTKRLDKSSLIQSVSQALRPSRSKQVFSATHAVNMNEVVLSPSDPILSIGFDSFTTPVGNPYIYPEGAPRKLPNPTLRQRPRNCRRSLARQFAKETLGVIPVIDTPPDSPAWGIDRLPETESDDEM